MKSLAWFLAIGTLSSFLLLTGCNPGNLAEPSPASSDAEQVGKDTASQTEPQHPEGLPEQTTHAATTSTAGGEQQPHQEKAEQKQTSATEAQARGKASEAKAKQQGVQELDEAATLLTKAMEAAQRGDFASAVEAVREAAEKNPNRPELKLLLAQLIFVRARQLLAEAGEDKEKLAEGARLAQEATAMARTQVEESTAEDPLRLQKQDLLLSALVFNAVAQTRQNNPDVAKELLREAVRGGLTNVSILEEDEELAALKTLPQFAELMDELRQIAAEQIKEEIRAQMEATEPFPFNFEVTDFQGETVRLADLKGKVVLVDFWGTWCPPCRAAIPHLVQLYNDYHDKGLEIIGLAYEQVESDETAREIVKKFAEQQKIPYKLALGDEQTQQQVPNFQGFPTVVLVDRDGKVRLVLVGYRPYEYYQNAVELLLNESNKPSGAEGENTPPSSAEETTATSDASQPERQPAAEEKAPQEAVPADTPSATPQGAVRPLTPRSRVKTLAQVSDDAASQDESGVQTAKNDKVTDLINRAQELARQGKMEQAVRVARQAYDENPDDRQVATFYARALFSYASQLGRSNQHLQAAKQYDLAVGVIRKLAEDGELSQLEENIFTLGLLSAAREYIQVRKPQLGKKRLLEALDRGFSQIEIIESDPFLRQLLEDRQVSEKIAAVREARAQQLREQALAELEKGTTFPFDFQLPDLSGKPVSLADFKGKVLIVDIWGTWCPPCRREVPHFVELHKKYRNQGLEIVGINFERVPEDQVVPTIQKFVQEAGVTYTCVVGNPEILQQIPGFRGYPTTLFIDRTGKVRAMIVGYRPLEFLEAIVQALLEEQPEVSLNR